MQYPKYIQLMLDNNHKAFVTDKGVEIIHENGNQEILISFRKLKTLYAKRSEELISDMVETYRLDEPLTDITNLSDDDIKTELKPKKSNKRKNV